MLVCGNEPGLWHHNLIVDIFSATIDFYDSWISGTNEIYF